MAKTRKDIDKDSMFQKIMPSADITNKKSIIAEKINSEEAVSTKQTDMQYIIDHAIALPQKNQAFIINIIEKAVSDNLDSVLDRFKCCKCDRCKKDIIALSLNSLPPKYVVAFSDRPLPDYRGDQRTAEVTTAIVRAVIKVKAEP
ncbi:MAG: late competence development ComFB family protein, partial [Oscillospiraceae bacterium]